MNRKERTEKLNRLIEAIDQRDGPRFEQLVESEWTSKRAALRGLKVRGYSAPKKQRELRKVQSGRILLVLSELINTEATYQNIAIRHNCTRQYVEQVARQAEAAGISIK